MAKQTVSFTLDSERDRDLVRWLDELPYRQRSAAIRAALRASWRDRVTLGDVYQAVRELERKIQAGVVLMEDRESGEPAADWPAEPPEAAAALDTLGQF